VFTPTFSGKLEGNVYSAVPKVASENPIETWEEEKEQEKYEGNE
jgi:hypothetical protein